MHLGWHELARDDPLQTAVVATDRPAGRQRTVLGRRWLWGPEPSPVVVKGSDSKENTPVQTDTGNALAPVRANVLLKLTVRKFLPQAGTQPDRQDAINTISSSVVVNTIGLAASLFWLWKPKS
jgi:hypothetical protein